MQFNQRQRKNCPLGSRGKIENEPFEKVPKPKLKKETARLFPYGGCSLMAECAVVVRVTRVRFPPSTLYAKLLDFVSTAKRGQKNEK
jgi:hypothetical protein